VRSEIGAGAQVSKIAERRTQYVGLKPPRFRRQAGTGGAGLADGAARLVACTVEQLDFNVAQATSSSSRLPESLAVPDTAISSASRPAT
jgi:hypothetical protein